MLQVVYVPNTPTLIEPMGGDRHREVEAALAAIGQGLREQEVEAAVVLSPHFGSRGGILLQGSAQPQQLFDFEGFPPAYYRPFRLPGAPALARELVERAEAAGLPVAATEQWGIDHGIWSPFLHMSPDASLPVLPVSLAVDRDPREYRRLAALVAELAQGRRLALMATGSLIHRLDRWDGQEKALPEAAEAFRAKVLEAWAQGRPEALAAIPSAEWSAAAPEGGRVPLEWLAGVIQGRSGTLVAAESEFGAVSLDVVVFAGA